MTSLCDLLTRFACSFFQSFAGGTKISLFNFSRRERSRDRHAQSSTGHGYGQRLLPQHGLYRVPHSRARLSRDTRRALRRVVSIFGYRRSVRTNIFSDLLGNVRSVIAYATSSLTYRLAELPWPIPICVRMTYVAIPPL